MDVDFEMCEPFGIDNGELDGLSPQSCFVLGWEHCQIRQFLINGVAIARPIHAPNADRLRMLCHLYGKECKLTYMEDDKSESWMWMEVPGKPPEECHEHED